MFLYASFSIVRRLAMLSNMLETWPQDSDNLGNFNQNINKNNKNKSTWKKFLTILLAIATVNFPTVHSWTETFDSITASNATTAGVWILNDRYAYFYRVWFQLSEGSVDEVL
jgi:hypothetical protein